MADYCASEAFNRGPGENMSKISFALIIVSVVLSAVAQILLKSGMRSGAVQNALSKNFTIETPFSVISNLSVLGGLFVYFTSALLWLLVLAKVDVSLAYPFVALGFVLTAVAGHLLFGEVITVQRTAGIVLVCAGVGVLARG